jgi:serine/threonine-protein kinase
VVWGSPHYFSPEQASGEPPTPASDVYSTGVVLFELLTGHLPFTGQDYRELAIAHIKEQPPSILDLSPTLPSELDSIIRKVLSKEPATRYRTGDQFGRILEKYREEGQQPTSSFVVKPSVAGQDDPAIEYHEAPQMQPAAPTLESLPPISMPQAQPARRGYFQSTYEDEADDGYSTYGDAESEPGIDFYGITLGVIAAVAVLGLVPLWIAVFSVLTRP